MKPRKHRPSDKRIRELNTLENYHPDIADYEIEAWNMTLSDLESARNQAQRHAKEDPYRWHGYQRAWFDRIQAASKAGY